MSTVYVYVSKLTPVTDIVTLTGFRVGINPPDEKWRDEGQVDLADGSSGWVQARVVGELLV